MGFILDGGLKRSLHTWPTGETLWRALEASPGICLESDVERTVCGTYGKKKRNFKLIILKSL
jgi:hypothetical protein